EPSLTADEEAPWVEQQRFVCELLSEQGGAIKLGSTPTGERCLAGEAQLAQEGRPR
ncbi:MAG: hypothetical protein RL033_7029, partial [Pseudomonadota bacterium]